jgi:hypothetical protein
MDVNEKQPFKGCSRQKFLCSAFQGRMEKVGAATKASPRRFPGSQKDQVEIVIRKRRVR